MANIDGPLILIAIEAQTVARVACASGAELSAHDAALPALPWLVEFRMATGELLRTLPFDNTSSVWVQIRGTEVASATFPISGGPGAPCSTSRYFVLEIENVDGPTVGVVIGSRTVATLACRATLTLSAAGELPPPPWTVEFRTTSGSLLGSVVADWNGARFVLIRGTTVIGWSRPVTDPAPGPCPTDAL